MAEIVALSGYARTGKDTVGAILVERHGYRRVAFADPIREALLEVNPHVSAPNVGRGLTTRQVVDLFGWEGVKNNAPEVRDLLQRMGIGMRRAAGDDVWIRAALAKINGPTVITDCRMPNEADAVRALGGEVWRVSRPGVGPANDHVTEHALDEYQFDRWLANDGTLGRLARRIGRWLEGRPCVSV